VWSGRGVGDIGIVKLIKAIMTADGFAFIGSLFLVLDLLQLETFINGCHCSTRS
jgi:hypothetical protein